MAKEVVRAVESVVCVHVSLSLLPQSRSPAAPALHQGRHSFKPDSSQAGKSSPASCRLTQGPWESSRRAGSAGSRPRTQVPVLLCAVSEPIHGQPSSQCSGNAHVQAGLAHLPAIEKLTSALAIPEPALGPSPAHSPQHRAE